MADHVAVLRRLRDMEEGAVQDAIDHAIATCEQHAEDVARLNAEAQQHMLQAMKNGQAAHAAEAKLAALVARLGELEKAWRAKADNSWTPDERLYVEECADDLARVVKESSDG